MDAWQRISDADHERAMADLGRHYALAAPPQRNAPVRTQTRRSACTPASSWRAITTRWIWFVPS